MTQQGSGFLNHDPIVVVYTAHGWTEAIVVRGLLESAGIPSPALGDANSPEQSLTIHGIDIYALASQAEHARLVIREYLKSEPDALTDDLEE